MYTVEYDTTASIDLNRGKYFKNKTRYYLIPTLYGFGPEFSEHWNRLTKLAVCIGDYSYSTTDEDNLYFLFDIDGPSFYGSYEDKAGSRLKFLDSLEYFKELDQYVTNYSFDTNQHMVVMQIPEVFEGIKQKFVEGKYSELYTEEQLESIIKKTYRDGEVEKLSRPFSVMKKTRAQQIKFKEQLQEDFGTEISESDTFTEYEYPPFLQQEIFNYEENGA